MRQYESATIELSGAYGPAEIYLEEYGVTHIFGDTDKAVVFAQGYAHARDRFFSMDKARRLGKGRLSELAGA